MRYTTRMRLAHASIKVELPHAQYMQLAGQLPLLIKQAVQQSASRDDDVAAVVLDQSPSPCDARVVDGPTHAAAAPRLLHYTHFPGCLTAVLEYEVERPLPPAGELAAQLQLLLPAAAQLVHVSTRDFAGGYSSSHSKSCGGSSCQVAGVSAWADPVALPCGDDSCSVDVILPAPVLQQLRAAAGQPAQLRVVVAAAGGRALSDRVLQVDLACGEGSGGAVEVRGAAPRQLAAGGQLRAPSLPPMPASS
jgi:hypothetical protein